MTKQRFIAKTFSGLERVLARELEKIGAESVRPAHRIVEFWSDTRGMYKANLHLRTALRILRPIAEFRAKSESEFYQKVKVIDWTQWLEVDATFAIDARVHSSFLAHSKYLALKTKDAIADHFRDRFGRRPSVDVRQPTVRLHVHLSRNRCTLSLDSSGDSLHKRGYRLDANAAPLNEVLAAGLVLLSGWDGSGNFVDPLCGSGTIVIEAALLAQQIPPGLNRRFGFMSWPDFSPRLWDEIRREALPTEQKAGVRILGSDISEKAIRLAQENARRAGVLKKIECRVAPFEEIEPPSGGGVLITNPPYDERLKIENARKFYQKLGNFFKQKCAHYDAWILSGNLAALKSVGLRPSQKVTLYNGGLESRFVKFKIYPGSQKQKNQSKSKKALKNPNRKGAGSQRI